MSEATAAATQQPAEPSAAEDETPHDSDNEPMVYRTPRDYASSARQRRDKMLADGADPGSVILSSQLRDHVPPRGEGESPADYVKRYSETTNGMIARGVTILNDQCVADVVPDIFVSRGRRFNLGPKSGATKGEYREFNKWFDRRPEDGRLPETPERWKKFEVPNEGAEYGKQQERSA